MVSFPSKIMSLLISPFPNGLPVGPHPSLFDPSVSPSKILLGYLRSFRLPLLPCIIQLEAFSGSPVMLDLPRNERADSLAKTGATLPITHVPCPLAPTIAKIRHTRYSLWRRNLSHNSLSCQIPSVFRLIRCKLSRLRCHGHSLLLSSYLCRKKTEREFFMQHLRTPSAVSDSPPPGFLWSRP